MKLTLNRGHMAKPDDQPVQGAKREADGESDEDQNAHVDLWMRGVQHRDRHAAEAEVGGHRQVERSGDKDNHLAEGQDDEKRGIVEYLRQIAWPHEIGEAQGNEQKENSVGEDEPNLARLDEPLHVASPEAARTKVSAVKPSMS
jgi:hypothetical protein